MAVDAPERAPAPVAPFEGPALLTAGLVGGLLAVLGAAGAAAQVGGGGVHVALVAAVAVVVVLLAWVVPVGLRAPGAPGTALVCLVVGLAAVVLGTGEDRASGAAIALGFALPIALLHQLVRRPRTGAAASLAATLLAAALVVGPAVWLVLADMRPAAAAAGLAAVGAAGVAGRVLDVVRPVPLLLAEPRRGLVGLAGAALAGGAAGGVLALAADGDISTVGGLGLGLVCGLVAALGDLVACTLALPATEGEEPVRWRGPAGGRAAPVLLQALLPLSLAAAPALALGSLAASG